MLLLILFGCLVVCFVCVCENKQKSSGYLEKKIFWSVIPKYLVCNTKGNYHKVVYHILGIILINYQVAFLNSSMDQ